jgi:hypothetical protein
MHGLHVQSAMFSKHLLPALQVQLQRREREAELVHPYSKSYGRSTIATILLSADGGRSLVRCVASVGS